MTIPRNLDVDRVRRNVARAGRSSIDHRERTAAVDLSLDAIAARKTAGDRQRTGRQLVDIADAVFASAKRNARMANDAKRTPRRRRKLSEKADEALVHAAVQIRIAQACPLDRPYLHALSLDKIQTIKAEVVRAFDEDDAALAVDTHRRILDQRTRVRGEGGPR